MYEFSNREVNSKIISVGTYTQTYTAIGQVWSPANSHIERRGMKRTTTHNKIHMQHKLRHIEHELLNYFTIMARLPRLDQTKRSGRMLSFSSRLLALTTSPYTLINRLKIYSIALAFRPYLQSLPFLSP